MASFRSPSQLPSVWQRIRARPSISRCIRFLGLAAVVVVLTGGQASAAPGTLSPEDTPAYAESVVKSTWNFWEPQLAAAGHPDWSFLYVILEGSDTQDSQCTGPVAGDPDQIRGTDPAHYCGLDNTVYLSTQWLYNHRSNGGTSPYGVAQVIAHEVGHAVQAELGLTPSGPTVKWHELQADCFSAVWVRQQVQTGAASDKDWQDARRAAQTGGDYAYDDPDTHGTADERVKFWMLGFNQGADACITINPPGGG